MLLLSKSIKWKLIAPIVVFFLLVLVVFSVLLPIVLSQKTERETVASAVTTSEQFKKLRNYYSTNIVTAVVNDNYQVTSSTDHKGQEGVIPIPATFLHDVTQEMSSENVKFSFYSPYPFANRVGRQLDDFNRSAWEHLVKNPNSAYSERFNQNGRQYMRVGIADLLTDQSCVSCHNSHPDSLKKDWKLNDVRGVVEMNIDITEELAADRYLSVGVITTLLILLATVVLVILFSFSRFIQHRVHQITRAVDGVVAGDLTIELDHGKSRDELAVIMQSINRITSQYKETIEHINESSNQLKERAASLNVITAEAKEGTQHQSKLTKQTDESMAVMLETVSQIAHGASRATESAKVAQLVSIEGRHVVDTSVIAVDKLSRQAEASTEIISQLQRNVEKIGTVSSVIGTIAEQTNLLALNAAIEAARAGEHGRGFAIVSGEVRSLATKTMSSTNEIDDIICQLQNTTQNMVEAMALNNDQASSAVEKIQETKRSLGNISNQVDEITQVNNDIQLATEQQTNVADNVQADMSEIAEISRNVEEGTNRIAQSAIELNEVAQQMQVLCQGFKLKS